MSRALSAPCAHRLAATIALALPQAAAGQGPRDPSDEVDASRPHPPPTLEAHRIGGAPPTIDGWLREPDWRSASVAGDFVVYEPDEGARPSQATEARVLYGPEALYVGIRAFDTAPDSIVQRLARRDDRPHSDWVDVVIDSYLDRRTAFRFGINPAGVKSDIYMFDDTNEDASWDAVWEVATQIDDLGWTAEFRIPYSQLRFDGAVRQSWGLNFVRYVGRHLETSLWAPISRGDGAMVSRFGNLVGLDGISPPMRLEVTPYSLASVQAAPGSPDDPFHADRDFASTLGADAKYGITSDLTLDLTVNPDFGQVEADPAQVNLSAFETFLEERRPFFVEGANIFAFGLSPGDDGEDEGLFYSRRIGRAPRGAVSDAAYADVPRQTRILGALKLSGKTDSGWSLGLLHSVTRREVARLADSGGTRLDDQLVEPSAHYGMARAIKDLRGGRSAFGLISTWSRRDAAAAEELEIHSGAYAVGADGRHRFGGDRFMLRAYLLGSTVRGSAAAIERTQRSPARYFQRPDADHLELDPTRTSLSGWAASTMFGKISGGYWRFGAGAVARSPGFDSNDLGFMPGTDFVTPYVWMAFQHYRPSGPFQRWNVNLSGWMPRSLGGDRYQMVGNINGNATLRSFWRAYAGVRATSWGLSNTALRGGPLLRLDPSVGGWLGFASDSRKNLQLSVGGNWGVTPATDSRRYGVDATLRWRPSSRATLAAGPFLNWSEEGAQWVGRYDLEDAHYLFARLAHTTAGMTMRADWTFSPELSLQLYAQPFVSAGSYDEYRQVVDPRAAAFADRFASIDVRTDADGDLGADIDGDGTPETIYAPDFNFKQFRSNAVLRWEYRPGSTLFAVWSQGRDHYASDGGFSLGSDLRTLMEQSADNVLMVKASYWIGS